MMIPSQAISFPNSLPRFRIQTSQSKTRTVNCNAIATAPSRSSSCTLYETLGLQSGATCHEIKAAYRRLAREIHPDCVADHRKEESANEFIRIRSAYATLSDPDKRRIYDREVVVRTAGGVSWQDRPTAGGARTGYSRTSYRRTSNWETDQCW